MKSKKVLAILLSMAIMLTFMPTMAFAAAGDPDTARYSVSVAGTTQTVEKSNIADAIAAVNDGGTITVMTGNINNDVVIDANKAFTLVLQRNTIASGVTISKANEDACLVQKQLNYVYHPAHNFTDASAEPKAADSTKADITVICDNGDSVLFEDVQGSVKTEDETKYVYEATVTAGSASFTCTWEVAKIVVVEYELEDVTYIQDDTGLAVKRDNKVQFVSNYTADGVTVLNSSGQKAVISGTIKSSTKTKDATIDSYGESTYVVEFTIPGTTEKKEVTVTGVMDTDKTVPAKNLIQGIQLKYNSTTGTTVWGELLATAPAEIAQTLADGSTLVNNSGILTYRTVYTPTEGSTDLYSEDRYTTWSGTPAEAKACGEITYKFDLISEKKTDSEGNIDTFTIQLPDLEIEAPHAYAAREVWAFSFTQVTAATHNTVGSANAKCQFCGKEWKDGSYVIPKTDDHTFEMNEAGTARKEYTVTKSCINPTFKYNKCTVSDGNWEDGQYILNLGEGKGTYTFKASDFADTNWHPVLVAGSVQEDQIGHSYYIKSATWESDLENKTLNDDVTFTRVEKCQICGDELTTVYHMNTLPAGTTAETGHVYGAITRTADLGANCSEFNKYTYTVLGIEDAAHDQYTKTVTSAVYTGPHTYKNTTNFSTSGKSATVLQECTRDDCKGKIDRYGNKATQTVDATVTLNDNTNYGYTTCTATIPNVRLTDGTLYVIDFSKNYVTVRVDDIDNAVESSVKGLVRVTRGSGRYATTVASDLYDAAITAPMPGEIVPGYNVITVTPVEGEEITSGGRDYRLVGTKEVTVSCESKGTLTVDTVKFDGKELGSGETSFDTVYDAKTHEVVATAKFGYGQPLPDATVKYAVVDAEADQEAWDAIAKSADPAKAREEYYSTLNFIDKAEMKDAGQYAVYAQISLDGYKTVVEILPDVEIEQKAVRVFIDDFTMTEGETPDFKWVVKDNSGNRVDVDKAEFVVTSIGGQALNELRAGGPYKLDATSENYIVTVEHDTGVGHVTVVTKDGKDPAEEAAAAVVAADEALVEAAKITTAGYTAESVKAVTDAQNALNAVLADKSSTTEQIKAATEALNTAVKNAVAKTKSKVKVAKKTLKVKAKDKKVAKTKTFKKALKAKKASGKVTFKKSGKVGGKYIVVKSNGTVIVKKGLKKGTYKVSVKATDSATDTTLKTTVKGKFTVKVK